MKKFAIVLSGCGVFDGSEIHEATLTMLAVAQNNAEYVLFAPDVEQHHVINHITGKEMKEIRNVLVESARIARGDIKSLAEFDAAEFDYLIFPGGFGAAKNLSSFAFDGSNAKVLPEVDNAIKAMLKAEKPIGALCISPAVIAKVIGDGVNVTIGNDVGTAEAIQTANGVHVVADHGEVVVDKKHKVYTTPCYMLDANIEQIYQGATNIVKAMLKA
ncbi:MAG: isoprenoid biosynthesis glyoxalase ElbB [Hyphomicrobiales bacterium]